jgi:prepilin-type N-terminal cleavage/methylation domain-containing protein
MKHREEAGFSLIEVMVALFIIAVATLIFGYFMTPLRQSKEAQQETQQIAAARNYLDNLRALWQDPDRDCNYVKLRLPTLDGFPTYRLIVTSAVDSSVILDYTSGEEVEDQTDATLLRNVELRILGAEKTIATLSTQVARINTAPENCP